MILFVFEGRAEDKLFDSIKKLFFSKSTDRFICTYRNNIYQLYSKLKEHGFFEESGVSTVAVLNQILQERGDDTLKDVLQSDISEIFLFFDYDFQHSQLSLDKNNQHVKKMLDYFNDETENGKLYINYPMFESIRYTRELPDRDYVNYTIKREQSKGFKRLTNDFSFYKSLNHLMVSEGSAKTESTQKDEMERAKRNWEYLVGMNVIKANYICSDFKVRPACKDDISQLAVFNAQLAKFVYTSECRVSILNAIPIFLYEYFSGIEFDFESSV